MTTYQSFHDHILEITSFELTKVFHMLFAALFVTAVFIVPTIGFITFLFL